MNEFRRLVVTGNTGSGKTTLSRRLNELTNIPAYHLDSIIYEDNWRKRPRHLIESSIKEITEQESWIIDGVSKQAYEKADTIIFLDLPPVVSFLRSIFRMFKGKRFESPQGANEFSALWLIVKLTFLFPKMTRPLILSYKNNSDKSFYQICNQQQLSQLLK